MWHDYREMCKEALMVASGCELLVVTKSISFAKVDMVRFHRTLVVAAP